MRAFGIISYASRSFPALPTINSIKSSSSSSRKSTHNPKPSRVDLLREPCTGFDKALQVSAAILFNVCERVLTKMLHVHCGTRLHYYLGQVIKRDKRRSGGGLRGEREKERLIE